MPLPEVGTLQQVDQLEAQRGPNFETENLSSPKGFPAPATAPIAIPGTGQTVEGTGGGSNLQSYINGVLGVTDRPTPGRLPSYSADIYNPRYSSILPGEDSEEAFAKAQPWWNKWGNALTKMGATAVGTFWNGLTAIPDTITSIKDGRPWDTSAGNEIDTWLKNLEDKFPNYYTKWENEHPFMSAVPGSGGSANFWSDKFLKNLGFTIGAIGGAAVQDAAVGVLTEGVGEVPLIGAQVGKAALWLNKVFTGTDKVEELLQLGRAAGRTGSQLVDLEKLAQAAAATKVSNGARFAMNLYGAAASEAGFEARDGYNTVRKDLIEAYQREKGYSPVGEDLEDIEKYARSSANVRFGANMVLLSISDAIQFDTFLKPFSAAKAGYRSTVQKELEEGLGTIGLKEGSLDTFEAVKPSGILGKLGARIKPYIPAALAEGVYEEGGQYGAQMGTQNYYERKFMYDKGFKKEQYEPDTTPWDARSQINNILHSTVAGMAAEFGTDEGLENIFLGALTGVFSAGVERFMDRKEAGHARQSVISMLNSQGVTGTFQNVYDNTVAAHRISEDMKQAVKSGDLFKYKNFQHEQFANFILSGLKAGRFDLRMAQLDLLRDMPNDQFKAAFGLDKTTESVKTVGEYVDKLKDKAKSIKRTYDLLDKTFENPFRYNRKAKDKEDLMENEKHNLYENWKDQLTFLASINKDTEDRLNNINKAIKEIHPSITAEQVAALTNRDSVITYQKALKEQAKLLEQVLKDQPTRTIGRPEDQRKLASLNRKIDKIDKALANPENTKVYQDAFEELLNYQLNGESENIRVAAPKEAIAPLMNYGVDINRLGKYKEAANDAFEVLSTPEGFEKFYKDFKEGQAKVEPLPTPEQRTATPGETVSTTPVIPAPVPKVTIKGPKGEQRDFEQGKEYYVDLGDKDNPNPQPVKIIGQTPDGVTTETKDGTQQQISPDLLFKKDKLEEDINNWVDEETKTTDNPPPPPTPVGESIKVSEAKKDMSFAVDASTDPVYTDKTTPFANFQRRHQNFLFNIGSTDPLVFNQTNKPLLRRMPVTHQTQEQFGFPKDFIADPSQDADNGTIRLVYVIDDRATDQERRDQLRRISQLVQKDKGISDIIKSNFKTNLEEAVNIYYEQYQSGEATRDELRASLGEDIVDAIVEYKEGSGIFFTDENGNKLGKVGEPIDPNKAVFTTAPTTDLTFKDQGISENRYTNKRNLDETKVQDWWRNRRKDLLEMKDLTAVPIEQFTISRGHINRGPENTRNSVVDVGLVSEKDLDKPVITILTLGDVAVAGALNDDGEGIDAHKESVNMGDMGKPLLNYGTNLIYLDSRIFTPQEARNIFDILKVIADRGVKPDEKPPLFRYLNKILYLANPKKNISATESSITIRDAELYLGTSQQAIQMTPESLEQNKDKIVGFLTSTYHNVNNTEILRIKNNPKATDLEFNELKVEGGKVVVARTWKNYNHYLLSSKTPDGKARTHIPLTTKAMIPQEGEVPMVGKYSIRKNSDFDSHSFEVPKIHTPPTVRRIEASDPAKIVEAIKKAKQTLITTEDGNQYGYSSAPENVIDTEKGTAVLMAMQGVPEMVTVPIDKIIEVRSFDENQAPFYQKQEPGEQKEVPKEPEKKAEEEKKKQQGVKSAEVTQAETTGPVNVEYITVDFGGTMGPVKLGFANIVTDPSGNITDLTPVGRIDEGGKITPFTNPDRVKATILRSLQENQTKKDNTNTPKEDNPGSWLSNPNLKKGQDPQYRYFTPDTSSYKVADLEREFQEFKRMLPRVEIQKVDQMLKTTSGGLAWGALEKGMIHIYKEARVGTTYHEAFEAVWNHFLNGKEQDDLYKEFLQREGNFKTFLGEKRNFSDATLKEAKEQMAEEFSEYKLTKRSPKNAIERFFQSIIDFIKRFIFGDKSEKNRVFDRLNRGYYRNYSTSLRNIDEAQFSRAGFEDLKVSEAFIQDAIQGMTASLFSELYKESADIINQLEEKPEMAISVIYSRLKAKLKFFFEDRTTPMVDTLANEFGPKYQALTKDDDRTAMQNQVSSILEGWKKMEANWPLFVREHQRYLRIFNVEFTTNDDGDIQLASDVTQAERDSENKAYTDYGAEGHMKMDAKSSASSKVKLLFFSIADSLWKEATKVAMDVALGKEIVINRENSLLALPKLAQYAKLFNYVLHNSSNINNIYDIWSHLKNMVENRKKIDANVQRFMNRVDFNKGFEGKTVDQSKIILALENAISKQKPAFFRQFVDYRRDTYFKTSVLNSKLAQVKASWIANMKGSGVVSGKGENTFVFSRTLLDIDDNIQFLNKLGIDIGRDQVNKLRTSDRNTFNDEVNGIKSLIKKMITDGTSIPIVSSKQIDFDARLNKLAEIYVTNIIGDDSQSQHPNLDNEPTSNFVLNNFVSTVASDANNSATKEEFINKIGNQYFNDIFHKDSFLLNRVLFDKDNKFNRPIQVGVVEGRESWNQDNKSASKLTLAERQLYEINNNFNGVYYMLLPADAKTEWAVYTGTYLSPERFFGDETSRGNEVTAFASQMYKWLQTEVDLAKDYPNRRDIAALNRKLGDRTVGNSLRFFRDILPEAIVNKIHAEVIDKGQPLGSVITEPEIRAILKDFVYTKAQKSLKNLENWSLVTPFGVDSYRVFGFDKNFLDNYLGKKYTYSRAELERLLAFREMNYVMNNIEMHKFFVGDPGQYKDELKRVKSFVSGREVTHTDTLGTSEGFNQRAEMLFNRVGNIQLSPGDPGYQTFKNHFNTFTLNDIEYVSDKIDEIKEAIGEERGSLYERGNEADAQAYMIAPAYREMMYKAGGRFTEEQEKQFQWEMAWERQDKAKEGKYIYTNRDLEKADRQLIKEEPNTEVAYPIIKLMHSGMQTVDDRAIASLDKASWAPLFYRWYKGTTLGKLHDLMQERGTDYVRLESAHKVGIQNSSKTSLYNDKGEVNEEGIKGIKDEMIPLKYLGVQVEQSKKDKGQTEGSQARKIVTGDLRSNGVPIDFIAKHSGDEKAAYAAWNQLSKEEKQKASPIYAKIKRHDDALRNLVQVRTDATMRRLGITQTPEGLTIEDKVGISNFILSELERRELPRNIAFALGIDPKTGDFSQPLEANAQYKKVRDILYSVIEKTVMRPKVSGGQKTMLSVSGFETKARIKKVEIGGKPVYVADTLKFYSRGKEGTEACEVMLPYWFGKKLQQMGSGRTKEEVIKYLNTTEEGKELLKGIGFRIPTQGLNSIDFFIVKDFLPEQMGDVIVLPSEITVKAGSDFDIDKLNTYLKNFYVDKNTGYPKQVLFKGTEEATKEYLGKLVDEGHILTSGQKKQLEEYIKSARMEGPEAEFFKKIPALAAMFTDEALSDKELTKEFVDNMRDNLVNKLYQQSLENEYFNSIEELLKLPQNYQRLVAPNDATPLKNLRNEIKRLKGTEETQLGEYGKLLDSSFMVAERQAYISSKKIVGTSARGQTDLAVAQNTDEGVTIVRGTRKGQTVEARFPHNEIDGKISLSGLYTAGTQNFISAINSQTTDGGVDVAKDKFLAEMGITDDTLPVFLALTRMGASERWSTMFVNQPAIQEFLRIRAIHRSVSQINPNIKSLPDYKIVSKTAELFPDVARKKALQEKPNRYTIEQMEGMIEQYYKKGEKFNKEQNTLQLQMLDDYLIYSSLGWDIFNYQEGYNWDTAALNDPNLFRLKEIKYRKANDLMLSRVDNALESTFIGAMKDNAEKLDEGLRSLINVQTGFAGSILQKIAEDLSDQRGLSKDIRQNLLLNAELSMVDYAIQTQTEINGKPMNTYLHSTLLGEKAVAKYIKAIQASGISRLVNNPFIKNLLAQVDDRKGYPSLVTLLERDYDTYTSNVWTDAFREMKDDHATIIKINNNPDDDRSIAQIYRNLVLAAILENGSKRTSTSLAHLVPNETYGEFTANSLRNIHLENFDENHVFHRVNSHSNLLVPTVEPENLSDDPLVEDYGYYYLQGETLNHLKEHMGTENIPLILNLEKWKYGSYKAVKTQYIQRDPDTNQVINTYTQLFARVDVMGADALVGLQITGLLNPRVIFKQINAWGDGNRVQEYHSTTNQSVLPNNVKVNEVDDDTLVYAMHKAGISMNIAESALYNIIADKEDDNPEADEEGNESPDPTDPTSPKTPKYPTAPFERSPEAPSAPIDFKQVEIEETKRSSKKGFFPVADSGEVGEAEGYKVTVKSHPNMQLFVYKRGFHWSLADEKTGNNIGLGTTAKEAVATGIENINKAIKSGRFMEILEGLGVAKKQDEPEQDLGECGEGKFSVKD